MKYECNDIFLVRIPSLPVHVFSDFLRFAGDGVEDFLQQNGLGDFMDQSILLASRVLSEAKEREGQSQKKHKAKERALLKYLIRSATRATPYGLFAGVALGEFGQAGSTHQLLPIGKSARPMKKILAIAGSNHKDPRTYRLLKL